MISRRHLTSTPRLTKYPSVGHSLSMILCDFPSTRLGSCSLRRHLSVLHLPEIKAQIHADQLTTQLRPSFTISITRSMRRSSIIPAVSALLESPHQSEGPHSPMLNSKRLHTSSSDPAISKTTSRTTPVNCGKLRK